MQVSISMSLPLSPGREYSDEYPCLSVFRGALETVKPPSSHSFEEVKLSACALGVCSGKENLPAMHFARPFRQNRHLFIQMPR